MPADEPRGMCWTSRRAYPAMISFETENFETVSQILLALTNLKRERILNHQSDRAGRRVKNHPHDQRMYLCTYPVCKRIDTRTHLIYIQRAFFDYYLDRYKRLYIIHVYPRAAADKGRVTI
jgi:hypothetical protein